MGSFQGEIHHDEAMHSGVSVSGVEPPALSFGGCQSLGEFLSLLGMLSSPIKQEQWCYPLQHHVGVGEAIRCMAYDYHSV